MLFWRTGPLVASMGPRLISRGNRRAMVAVDYDSHASMGPRLISRGNAGVVMRVRPYNAASMGPRLISRGNLPSDVR